MIGPKLFTDVERGEIDEKASSLDGVIRKMDAEAKDLCIEARNLSIDYKRKLKSFLSENSVQCFKLAMENRLYNDEYTYFELSLVVNGETPPKETLITNDAINDLCELFCNYQTKFKGLAEKIKRRKEKRDKALSELLELTIVDMVFPQDLQASAKLYITDQKRQLIHRFEVDYIDQYCEDEPYSFDFEENDFDVMRAEARIERSNFYSINNPSKYVTVRMMRNHVYAFLQQTYDLSNGIFSLTPFIPKGFIGWQLADPEKLRNLIGDSSIKG